MSAEGISTPVLTERPGNVLLRALRTDLCQTTEQLSALTGLNRKNMNKVLGTLVSSGYAARRDVGCFVLTAEGEDLRQNGGVHDGPQRPHTSRRPKVVANTMTNKMWSAMRINPRFTIDDLITLTGCTHASAWKYIRVLRDHGYVIQLAIRLEGTALTSPGKKRWVLTNDTGPLAPVWRPSKLELFDRNLDRVVTK